MKNPDSVASGLILISRAHVHAHHFYSVLLFHILRSAFYRHPFLRPKIPKIKITKYFVATSILLLQNKLQYTDSTHGFAVIATLLLSSCESSSTFILALNRSKPVLETVLKNGFATVYTTYTQDVQRTRKNKGRA